MEVGPQLQCNAVALDIFILLDSEITKNWITSGPIGEIITGHSL